MKKNLFFLLLMGLIFASCSKDISEHEQKILPAGTRLQLSLSASILDDAAQQDKNNTKALDFYVDTNNKVRATLKGKTSVKVKTYLYSDNTLIWSEDVDWKVINNGAGLHFDKENIVTSAPMQVGKTKLIAILATESSLLTEPTVDRQYSITAIEASNDGSNSVSIDVPYAMESNITVTTERGTNKGTAEANRVFKPYGNILHFTIENPTNDNVTVTDLLISDYNTKYTLKPDELSQGAKKKDANDIRGTRRLPIYPRISIAANNTSTKHLLLWVGSLPSTPVVSLQATGSPRSLGYYATYTNTKETYNTGKTYHAKLKIREIKNPLSYFADGFVDKLSGGLLSMSTIANRNYSPTVVRQLVGRFSTKQLLGESDWGAENDMFYPARYVYRPIRGYRVPTEGNFQSIGLHTGPRHGGFYHEVDYSGVTTPSYEYMEYISVATTIGNFYSWRGAWQHLFAKIPYQGLGSPGDPLSLEMQRFDITNYALGYIEYNRDWATGTITRKFNKAFAFRYKWDHAHKYHLIQCKFVGTENITSVQQLKDQPESFWNQGNVERRELPCITTKYTSGIEDPHNGRRYTYSDGIKPLNLYSTSNPLIFPSVVPQEDLTIVWGYDGGFIKAAGSVASPGQGSIWPYKINY